MSGRRVRVRASPASPRQTSLTRGASKCQRKSWISTPCGTVSESRAGSKPVSTAGSRYSTDTSRRPSRVTRRIARGPPAAAASSPARVKVTRSGFLTSVHSTASGRPAGSSQTRWVPSAPVRRSEGPRSSGGRSVPVRGAQGTHVAGEQRHQILGGQGQPQPAAIGVGRRRQEVGAVARDLPDRDLLGAPRDHQDGGAEGRQRLEAQRRGSLQQQDAGEALGAVALPDGDFGARAQILEAAPRVLEPRARRLHLGSEGRRGRGARAGAERERAGDQESERAPSATSSRSSAWDSHRGPGAASRAPPGASS